MPSAEMLRAEFTRFLDNENLIYTIVDEADNQVQLSFEGDSNLNDVIILVDFDEDGFNADAVCFSSRFFAKKKPGCSRADLLEAVNKANMKYRWITFYVTNDDHVSAQIDANVYPGSVGEECTQITLRMVSIIKDAFRDLSAYAYENEDVRVANKLRALMARLG